MGMKARKDVIELLSAVGSIILIDLVLSGDNALVIGAAAAGLHRRQRWYAIALGGGGAMVLRIAFAIIASLLLRLPLLQAIGGVLLLLIAVRLLLDRSKKSQAKFAEHTEAALTKKPDLATDASVKQGFWAALLTILVADVTMSLDNVLAIGALAAGNVPFLVVGLLLSITLLLLGSALVAELIGRFPWLLDVAALVLAWTAANMIQDDIRLGPVLENLPWTQFALPIVAFGTVLTADILLRLRKNQRTNGKSTV
jgi:YjbE family integral membrane protein